MLSASHPLFLQILAAMRLAGLLQKLRQGVPWPRSLDSQILCFILWDGGRDTFQSSTGICCLLLGLSSSVWEACVIPVGPYLCRAFPELLALGRFRIVRQAQQSFLGGECVVHFVCTWGLSAPASVRPSLLPSVAGGKTVGMSPN